MQLNHLLMTCCLYGTVLVGLCWQEAAGEATASHQTPSVTNNGYPGKMAWELKPGMEWQQSPVTTHPDERKSRLGHLYEQIDLGKKDAEQAAPRLAHLLGLRLLKYYVVGSKGDNEWKLVDSLGKVSMKFNIFYAPDRVYSRQAAMGNFMKAIACMPHLHIDSFMYQTQADGSTMLIRNEELRRNLYLVEKDGYALWLDAYSHVSLSKEETIQVTAMMLDALAGSRPFSYYPKRAKIFTQWGKLSLADRDRLFDELWDPRKSMSSFTSSGLYAYKNEMVQTLGVESVAEKSRELNEKIIPNANRGVGTLTWIRKHLNIPFTPAPGTLDQHVDGITGVFLVKKGAREYPVDYMIAHLPSRKLTISALFSMQAKKAVHSETKEEDIRKVAAMTQVHPGLVGDYDLCLKPVINGLGVPVPGSEHAWICFVRGNTAVMLKSMDLKVSVLPLAKILDEALKKGIEAYEKPEFVR